MLIKLNSIFDWKFLSLILVDVEIFFHALCNKKFNSAKTHDKEN